MISLEEFKKIELRVGKVEKVEDIKDSKKLYKLIVDFGEEKRQIVSGIKNYYKPEDLEGKQFIFITNLEPAKIMGEVSEGMILAASDGEHLCLICPEKEIKNGAKLS
ncbi:MAG: methionine--tRNA ligase subunit beta [Candidatus Aenigmarchaeota archaeon]|nr:methionine--tRNA ligase subunit beta [Candidatus Aenigmarchaeota archaeon]MBU5688836.1 methionine--tRNA ligase subunit beta [Candidatus Aenigmarchaeota archaeon]